MARSEAGSGRRTGLTWGPVCERRMGRGTPHRMDPGLIYAALTDAEKAHYDEYAVLRSITGWPGFSRDQAARKQAAREWLTNRHGEIGRSASPHGDGHGWDYQDRQARFELLAAENLDRAKPHPGRRASLPTLGCTDPEKAYIEEREVWWRTTSTTDEQR